MSDRDEETPAAIARRNLRTNRAIREYWRQRGVDLGIADDPSKGPRACPGGTRARMRYR